MKETINDKNEEDQSFNTYNYNFRGYIVFWIGQLTSLLGSSVVQFSIIWWITVETNSEFFLALAAFLGFGPTIILTPIAGVYVDRWSRKKIIATVDFLQAMTTIFLIYLFSIGQATIWTVLILNALRGCFQAFHGPAVQAIIPLLIPKDKLSRMNGLDYLLNGVIALIGPVIGALLLEIWLIYEILWLDAITFVIAIIPTIIIRIPSIIDKSKKLVGKLPFRVEFTEGISFIKEKRGLLALLAVFSAANFFLPPIFIMLPLYVTKIHFGIATDLAFIMVAQQAGLILGALLMSSWKGFSKNVKGVAIGILMMYVSMFIITFTPKGLFLVSAIGMLIMGFALPIANVSSQTIWQKVVPPEKLGRVYSVRITIAQFSAPAAMIITGIIAETIGVLPLYFLAGVMGFTCLCYSWFFTGFKYVESTIYEEKEINEEPLPFIEPTTTPSSEYS